MQCDALTCNLNAPNATDPTPPNAERDRLCVDPVVGERCSFPCKAGYAVGGSPEQKALKVNSPGMPIAACGGRACGAFISTR